MSLISKDSIPSRVNKLCKVVEAGNYKKAEAKLLSHKNYYNKYLGMLLALAVIKQDRGMIQLLIKQGASINLFFKMEGDTTSVSPLIRAIKLNNIDLVSYLIQNGADINLSYMKDYTPLMHAVIANNCALVQLLVKYGVDIKEERDIEVNSSLLSIKSNIHTSALNLAINIGNFEMIKLLVNNGARPSRLIFHNQAIANSIEVLKYLYSNIDVTDTTLLTFASEKYNLILFTVENILDLSLFYKNCQDNNREAYHEIMMLATYTVRDKAKTVNDLIMLDNALSLGIDLDLKSVSDVKNRVARNTIGKIKSDRDINLLSYWIENKILINSYIISEFLSDIILNDNIEKLFNIIIELCDNKKSTGWMSQAFVKTIKNGKYDRVKLLVENGADINSFLHSNNEPIYIAFENYNPEIIIYLIEKGANLLNIGPSDDSAVEIMNDIIMEHKLDDGYFATYNEMLDYIIEAQENQYKEHNWKDCICSDCGLIYHAWEDCTCSKCGASRQHKLDEKCKCKRCHTVCHDGHWEEGHDQMNICRCKKCGTVVDYNWG